VASPQACGTMKPGELIDLCIECYKTYQPSKVTLDSHIEVFLAKIDCNDEGDVVFIKQVVYGCIRYKKLNKVTLTALYFKHGTQVSREDYHLYMVFSYLTLIRLEDMSVPVFRKFVMSQDHHKMFVWVSFIFNAQTLNKWMKEEWCRIFDEQYVEDDLIAKLLRNLPEISDLIERLREIASTKDEDDIAASDDKKEKKVTRPVPFQLSKPKPRMVPEPFPIHLGNPYKQPIPATTFDADVDPTRKKVDEARQKARDEVAKKAAHARAPEFATAKLPESKVVRAGKYKDALAQEHEQKLQAATRYVPAQPSDPAPALKAAETASVRLNTAAVLREDALLRKKQMEEAALIKKYESELRDDSEYYEWQVSTQTSPPPARSHEPWFCGGRCSHAPAAREDGVGAECHPGTRRGCVRGTSASGSRRWSSGGCRCCSRRRTRWRREFRTSVTIIALHRRCGKRPARSASCTNWKRSRCCWRSRAWWQT